MTATPASKAASPDARNGSPAAAVTGSRSNREGLSHTLTLLTTATGRGPVRWLKPWTLGSSYVFPEVFFIALAGFVSATLFTVAVVRRELIPSVAAFVTTLVLLAYPFFAGLTSEGQRLLWFGPFIGIAALAVSCRNRQMRARAHS